MNDDTDSNYGKNIMFSSGESDANSKTDSCLFHFFYFLLVYFLQTLLYTLLTFTVLHCLHCSFIAYHRLLLHIFCNKHIHTFFENSLVYDMICDLCWAIYVCAHILYTGAHHKSVEG